MGISEFAGPENNGPNLRAGKWMNKSVECIYVYSSPASFKCYTELLNITLKPFYTDFSSACVHVSFPRYFLCRPF